MKEISADGRSALGQTLDFDADRGRIGNDIQLLDPYTDSADAAIFQGERGNALRQGLDKAKMTFGDDGADAIHDVFVVDDVFKTVADGRGVLADGEIDIYANRLGPIFLVTVDADMSIEDQISHKDVPDRVHSRGDAERLGGGVAGHGCDLAWRAALFKISALGETA